MTISLRSLDSFEQFRGAAQGGALSLHVLRGTEDRLKMPMSDHLHTSNAFPIGIYRTRDICISGIMYPFLGTEFIDDETHIGAVSKAWLSDYPQHNPGAVSRVIHTIDGPALPLGGPGHRTYGHWLIDYLPRIAIAREVMGEEFSSLRVLLLNDTPAWAVQLAQKLCGLNERQIFWVSAFHEEIILREAILPTPAHSGWMVYHPWFADFYRNFLPVKIPPGGHRLCVVRRERHVGARNFAQRDLFEGLAKALGFFLFDPASVSLDRQIATFAAADTIIGEYGSGMHNAVFARQGCRIIVLNVPGIEQSRIAAAFGHQLYLAPGVAAEHDGWDLSGADLERVFDPAEYVGVRNFESL